MGEKRNNQFPVGHVFRMGILTLNSMKRKYFIAGCLLITAFFSAFSVSAQKGVTAAKDTLKLRQEVEVTKAYQPTVPEAIKINDIPKIKAEQTEAPTFDYSIFSKPVFSTFEPTPVAAAKMVGDPREEMGKGLLKLGIGNYQSPYGELFFNAQPDKSSNFGMHFKHLSSSGKVKLLNNDKVKAPESENVAEIYGEKFYRKSTLSGSLGFDRSAFRYYGYTGDKLSDDQKSLLIPYFQEKQSFSKGIGKLRLKSETLSNSALNYDFGLKFSLLKSKTGQTENLFAFSGDMGKKFDKMFGSLNTSLTYYQVDSVYKSGLGTYGSKQQILLQMNPSVKWQADRASLLLGLNSTMVFDDDDDASFLVWPKLKADWSPVPQILTLFVSVDGHLQHNTYSAISVENRYADPYHDMLNSKYTSISGGFKGKLSSKTNYVAEASYSMIEDHHFYILEAVNYNEPASSAVRRLNNTFGWIYDDLNVLRLSGEIMHSVSEKFALHLLGNYYSYEPKAQLKAWQMPEFDFSLSGIFRPTEQLKFTADIFVVGNRTALIRNRYSSVYPYSIDIEPSLEEIPMDPIIDMNVGVDYRFSERLNFFVKLNNFGFQKYEQWLGYTNKGINGMAGISYAF